MGRMVKDEELQYYDQDHFSVGVTSYLKNLDDHSASVTLYEMPNDEQRRVIIQKSSRVIMNIGYLGVNSDEIDTRRRYVQEMRSKGIDVTTYSDPRDIHRIHMKTYAGTIGGQSSALIATGNLTDNSLNLAGVSSAQNYNYRRVALNSFENAGHLIPGVKMPIFEQNMAIATTNPQTIANLKAVQDQAIRVANLRTDARAVHSVGDVLVGPDARANIINDINRTNSGSITLTSPYADDRNLAMALVAAKQRGVNVTVISENIGSTVKEANTVGGNVGQVREYQTILSNGGVNVYVPQADDPLLYHAKSLSIINGKHELFYLGSDNLTSSTLTNQSLEVMVRGEGKVARQVSQSTLSSITKQNLLRVEGNKGAQYGYSNNQLAPFFSTEADSPRYKLPTRHGVSYFYSLSLYEAGVENGGETPVDIVNKEGYATAFYRMTFVAQHAGKLPEAIPGYVSRYDQELNTPGLGYYMNLWGEEKGFGRIYKDEIGAIPSFAGAIGAMIDKSMGYYLNTHTDYEISAVSPEKDSDDNAIYKGENKGPFESLFSGTASFIKTTTISMVTYFAIGVPYDYITSEAFRANSQHMLDIATGQAGKHALYQMKSSKMGAALSVLGADFLDERVLEHKYGIDFKDLAKKKGRVITYEEKIRYTLLKLRDENKLETLLTEFNGSVISIQNTIFRKRAGLFFTNIVEPFLTHIINPFTIHANDSNFMGLQRAMKEYHRAISTPIKVAVEYNADDTVHFIMENVGYKQNKAIARSLDEMLSYLPANPLRWGFFNETKAKDTSSFSTLGEYFSFTAVLKSFNSIYFGKGFNEIMARAEVLNNTSALNNSLSKIESFLRVPGEILKAGMVRFQDTFSMNSSITRQFGKLRNVQTELVKKGVLTWDAKTLRRTLNGSKEEVEQFMHAMMDYRASISPHLESAMSAEERNAYILREHKMMRDANEYFKEEEYFIGDVNKLGKNIADPLIAGRGKLGLGLLALLGAGIALDDLMGSYNGASLFSQVEAALHHKDIGASPDFSANQILPVSGKMATVLSVGYTLGIAVGGGYAIAAGSVSKDFERYSISEESTQVIRDLTKGMTRFGKTDHDLFNFFMEDMKVGVVTPKGNFLRNFVIATTALLAARVFVRWGGASILNVIKTLPVIGPALFGKQGLIDPNENIILAEELGTYRRALLNRIQAGHVQSDLNLHGGYLAGVFGNSVNMQDTAASLNSKSGRNTGSQGQLISIAEQAPLPIITFYATMTVKGSSIDSSGQTLKRGMMDFSVGVQSAPILGKDISLSAPVLLNMDAENDFGLSLVYNDDPNNVFNYISAVNQLGSATLLGGAGMIGVLDGTAGLAAIFGKDTAILREIQDSASTIKAIAKGADKVIDTLMLLPHAFVNAGKTMVKSRYDTFNELGKVIVNNELHIKNVGLAHSIPRLMGLVGVTYFEYKAIKFVADMFVENDTLSNYISIGASVAITGASIFGNPVYNKISHIASKAISFASFQEINAFKVSRTVPIIGKTFAKMEAVGVQLGLSRRNKFFIGATAAITVWNYLKSSSWFGKTVGMDLDQDGKYDWAKQIMTVGMATAATMPAIALSNLGMTATDAMKEFREGNILSQTLKNSPLTYVQSVYHKWNAHMLRKDLLEYRDITNHYILRRSTEEVASELSGLTHGPDELKEAINNIKTAKVKDLQNVFDLHGTTSREYNDLAKSYAKVFNTSMFDSLVQSSRAPIFARRLGKGFIIAAATAAIIKTGISFVGEHQHGRTGQDAVDDAFSILYNHKFFGAIGGKFGGKIDDSIGQALTLTTQYDKRREAISQYGGYTKDLFLNAKKGYANIQGQHMLKMDSPEVSNVQNQIKEIFSPVISSPQKPFQSIIPFVGASFRQRDKGIDVNFYTQVQTADQDISASVYASMKSYYFKEALMGKNQFREIYDHSLQLIRSENLPSQQTLDKISLAVATATAQLDPLDAKFRRKFTVENSESTMKLISGDALLSYMYKDRLRRTVQLANQHILSVVNRMANNLDPDESVGVPNGINLSRGLRHNYDATTDSVSDFFNSLKKNKNFLYSLFSPLNHTTVHGFSFKWDLNSEHQVSAPIQGMTDNSEWDSQDSVYLDMNSIDTNPWTNNPVSKVLDKATQSIDALINSVSLGSPFVKMGITIGLAGGLGMVGLGLVGQFFFSQDAAKVLSSTNLITNLFNRAFDPLKYDESFKARYRITNANGIMISGSSTKEYQVTRGNQVFSLHDASALSLNEINSQMRAATQEVAGNVDTFSQRIFSAYDDTSKFSSGFWKNNQRKDVIETMSKAYDEMIEHFIDTHFDILGKEIGSTGKSLGNISSRFYKSVDAFDGMKSTLKEEMSKQVKEMLETEIKNGDVIGEQLFNRYRNAFSDKETVMYLSHLVTDKLSFVFRLIDQNLLLFESEGNDYAGDISAQIQKAIRDKGLVRINSGAQKSILAKIISPTSKLSPGMGGEAEEDLTYMTRALKRNRLHYGETLVKGFHGIFMAVTLFESYDIYSSFSMLSMSQSGGFTTGEQRYYAQHAGSVAENVGMWVGFNRLMSPILDKAPEILSIVSKNKSKTALVIAGVILAATIAMAARENINRGMESFMSHAKMRYITEHVSEAYENIGNFLGEGILNIGEGISKITGGAVKPANVTQVLGFALAAANATFNFGGAFKSLNNARTVLSAAGIAGGIGALLSYIPGFNSLMGTHIMGMNQTIEKIPYIGGFVTPLDNLLGQVQNRYIQPGSPITAGTAAQVIASDYARVLLAAQDHTGARTSGLFTNPSILGQAYNQVDKINQLDTFDNAFTIRPRNLLNPLLDRELQIRGQYYNQAVLGRVMWEKMTYNADNVDEINEWMKVARMNDGKYNLHLKQVDGRINAEVAKLRENICQGKGTVTPTEAQTLNKVIEKSNKTTVPINARPVVSVAIENGNYNKKLTEAAQNLLTGMSDTQAVPVLSTTIKSRTRRQGNKILVGIEENISNVNDTLQAITRGMVTNVKMWGFGN